MTGKQQYARAARLLVDTLRLTARLDAKSIANEWQSTDAHSLTQLADAEGAALLLHRRLKALAVELDGDAKQLIKVSAKRIVAQSLRGDAELATTLQILDSVDVQAVPLKGAAMRRLGDRVPYAGVRMSSDVDVLVPMDAAQRGWDALVANGYHRASDATSAHHLPGLVGAAGIGVEIHVTTVPAVSPDEAWRRATYDSTVVDFNGKPLRVPSDTELLWHSATHGLRHTNASVRDGIRLRHWLDNAALLAADAHIDWARLEARLHSTECPHPNLVRAWIATSAELAGRALPPAAFGGAPVLPINIERLLAWRLWVASRTTNARWADKLLEEGTRGEAMLPQNPGYPSKGPLVRTRHFIASRAARIWWRIRR